MRLIRTAFVVVAMVAAGCAEPLTGGSGPDPEDPILAYADLPGETGLNRTILLLRAESADRVTYIAGGSWLPRLAPGIDDPNEDLTSAFERTGTTERGGLVVRVERGDVSDEARDGLRPFLMGEWPASATPPGEPHPWHRPLVLVRTEPKAWAEAPSSETEDLPAEHAALGDLVDAFTAAHASFVPTSVQEAVLPFDDAWPGCLQASTSVEPEAARVGETITIRAKVENCGASSVTLDPLACAEAPTANVQVSAAMVPFFATMPASEEPRAAYALDLVCRGDAAPVTLAAGASATLTRRWNGTFAACSDDRCEYRPASAGEYAASTFASGQRGTTPASMKLIDANAQTARVLVVREFDWVNTTATDPIEGDFGPHCALVAYTREPASVTLAYYEEKPAVGDAIVIRDWREGERPQHTATFSADRIDVYDPGRGPFALASPFDAERALARVSLDGDTFDVDGTRIALGDTHVLRNESVLERNGARYEVTSILVFEHLGDAPIVWQRAGVCA